MSQSLSEAFKVLYAEEEAIADVRDGIVNNVTVFTEVAQKVDKANHVILTGVGKSGFVAQRGAALLCSVGVPASFMHAIDALHGDCGRMRTGDVLIALSHSGETDEVCHFVHHVRSWVETVAITSNRESRLGRICDNALTYIKRPDGGAHGFLPTVSCAAQTGYIDSLAVYIATSREVDPQMFLRHHPGGNLGRTLR